MLYCLVRDEICRLSRFWLSSLVPKLDVYFLFRARTDVGGVGLQS